VCVAGVGSWPRRGAYDSGVGKIYDSLDGKLRDWLLAQPLFFVATAPSGAEGHVNCSPKGGIETFRILGPREVAYLDFVGSGAETVAHLQENGRIVVMFCAFQGPPRIVRLHGRGTVRQLGDPGFEELYERLEFSSIEVAEAGVRSIVAIAVERIADSCGYGVPLMRYEGARTQQKAWLESLLRNAGPNGVLDYSREHNGSSIDGLPAIDPELLPDRA
jgi:Pyridoxamine 5'-phosphate oxidase